MTSPLPPLNIPDLLRQHGLHPKKSLGQNFLIDSTALEKVVNAGGVERADTVLEIGPGLGSLTRHLAIRAARVIAVELDQHLIPILHEVLAPFHKVEIIHGDILDLDPHTLISASAHQRVSASTNQQLPNSQFTIHNSQLTILPSPYLVIANIPYYITSALTRHLLESGHPPTRMVLTVQREVAERLCAAPARARKADAQMSLLALSVQVYGQPAIVGHIPASAFYPVPQVDSAVVRVDLYPEPRIPRPHLDTFFRLAKTGYGQKRKTIRNAFLAGLGWPKEKVDSLLTTAGIDPIRRAETLTLDEWSRLVNATLE